MRTIVLLLAVALVGCGSSDTCSQSPVSCEDAGQGTCNGQCAGVGSGEFLMLWSGPAGTTPPACPAVTMPGAANPGFLDAPPSKVTCSPACACEPSGNECYLPTTMTASTAACPASGSIPFNAPNVWNGVCSMMDPVASAGSLTVDPPALAGEGTCAASTANVGEIEGGDTIAVTCNSPATQIHGVCPSANEACVFPNVPSFSVCTAVALTPGATCADVPGWPVQHTFFFATCTCTCGAPEGEVCSTTVTAYEDGTCSDPVGSVTLTSNDGPTCGNISPASPLGSKKASVNYTPGTCAPTLTPIGSETLCCLPPGGTGAGGAGGSP